MDEARFDETLVGPVRRPSRRAVLRGVAGGGVAAAFLAAGWRVAPASAQEASPGATPEASPVAAAEPNAIVVLFGQPTDEAAFEEYYLGTHRPLALTIPGLQEILGGPVLGTLEGGEAEYYRIAILRFADRADLEAGVASPEGVEAFADVPNLATGGATAFLTRLESNPGPAGTATPAA